MSDTLFEFFTSPDDAEFLDISNTLWRGQTLTPNTVTPNPGGHSITSVIVRVRSGGVIGTATLSIRNTSGGLPTGGDLTSAPILGITPSYALLEATFATPVDLDANVEYSFVMRISAGGAPRLHWRKHRNGGAYPGGQSVASVDSGASWIPLSTDDGIFQEFGLAGGGPITSTLLAQQGLLLL